MKRLLFLLSLTVLTATAEISEKRPLCRNTDYSRLENGKCYRLFSTKVTFQEAISGCKLTGGHLVSIHNQTDGDDIGVWAYGYSVPEPWIGLQCDSQQHCTWIDGTPLDYTNFDDTPPNLNNGNCFYMKALYSAVFKYNVWANTDCGNTMGFVCEENDDGPVTTPDPNYTCGDFSEYNGQCYGIQQTHMSFANAEATCSEQGGHLVSVHDNQTNQFLYNLLQQSGIQQTAWIGLTYNPPYTWTDYTQVNFLNVPGALTPGTGTCLGLSNVPFLYPSQWVPNNCQTAQPFICQRQKTRITTTTTTTTPVTKSVCGQTYYTSSEGKIVSPNYPYSFQSASCNYLVDISNVVNAHAVNVQIPAIQALGYWILSLYEGTIVDPSLLIATITSNDPPAVHYLSSPSSQMLIQFSTGGGVVGQPFFITYNGSLVPQFPTGNLTVPTQAPTNCDSGWTYDYNMQMCYHIFGATVFNNAQVFCTEHNAQLLSIHNWNSESSLQRSLSNYYNNGYSVWLGGKYSGSIWQWTDGTPMNYQNWLVSPPMYASNVCISEQSSQSGNGWVSLDCNTRQPFICGKLPSY